MWYGVKAGHVSTLQKINNGLIVTIRQKDKTKSVPPPPPLKHWKIQRAASKKGIFFHSSWVLIQKHGQNKNYVWNKTSTPSDIQKETVNQIQLMPHINWLDNQLFSSWS